jgi:probable blue pigment (indigoidine) exporter
MPPLSGTNLAGFAYLSLVGCALTYVFWFRGISRLETTSVSRLALLSPVTATVIGVLMAGESLSILQMAGIAIVVISMTVSGGSTAPRFASSDIEATPVSGGKVRAV